MALSKEKRTVFHHITAHHQIRVELPVSLKVGARTLVVSTVSRFGISFSFSSAVFDKCSLQVKRIELFSDIKCTLDDVIEISDIEEIRKISIGPEGDGISIRVAGEPRARRFMVLANNRRDELFYVGHVPDSLSSVHLLTSAHRLSIKPAWTLPLIHRQSAVITSFSLPMSPLF